MKNTSTKNISFLNLFHSNEGQWLVEAVNLKKNSSFLSADEKQ